MMHHVVENININLKASPFHRFLNNLEAAAAGPPCGWENIKLGKGWISRLGQFSAGCSPRAVDARAPWAALCIKCHLAWNHSPPTPPPGWYQPCHSHTARACMPGVRGEGFERCEHAYSWKPESLLSASPVRGWTRNPGFSQVPGGFERRFLVWSCVNI